MRANQRVTTSTQAALQKEISVIEYLRDKKMTMVELCKKFCMSSSGMRNHLHDISVEGLLLSSPLPGTNHVLQFSLVPDQKRIDSVLNKMRRYLAEPKPVKPVVKRAKQKNPRSLASKELLPGTHIHLAEDDAIIPLRKIGNAEVKVQRGELETYLFGPARSQEKEAA